MKRVAVFGNAGGVKAPHEEYLQAHTALLANVQWIIDGFGGIKLLWERLEVANTLIHVDLPLAMHAFWVTKRLVKGLFAAPQGRPEGGPVTSSSISGYRVLWPCHTRLTPGYRVYVA